MSAGRSVSGREGPSIQLGAMTGQGISRLMNRGKTEENYIMTCGASAGLAAAFHAPLAGMMFALEEIHKGFSVTLLVSVMTASVTADYISSYIIGLDPVFQFRLEHVLPQNYYWLLIVLGIVLGVFGALYNKGMLKAQELYKKWKWLNETKRLVIAFMAAGVMAVLMPSVLGSGGDLIVFADKWRNGIVCGHRYLCGEIPVFCGKLRLRRAGRHFLSPSYSGSSSWRGVFYGMCGISRAGSGVHKQFCPSCHGRIFYSDCESADYRNYPLI